MAERTRPARAVTRASPLWQRASRVRPRTSRLRPRTSRLRPRASRRAQRASRAHDVLLGYLRKAQTVVELRPWLIGAICYASRHYWRLNGRILDGDPEMDLDRADPASVRILDSLPDQLAAREALECLSPRCQEVLHMRYFEGMTIAEVAGRLGVKTKYAQKLITKCLRRAEKLYGQKGRGR